MNSNLKIKIENIISNIISDARIDKSGISWETIYRSHVKDQFEKSTEFNISNGSLGITLFLIEYYRHSQNKAIPKLIELSLQKAFSHFESKEKNCGFYFGWGGAIYVLIEAHKHFPENNFLEMAMELANKELDVSSDCNINTGLAGLLIALVHLYEFSGNSNILDKIELVTLQIVDKVIVHQNGIYWDVNQFGMKPLTGFLYGNSGIIFTLQEASKVFKDSTVFSRIIKEGLNYEDYTYNAKTRNWPDYLNEKHFFFNQKTRKKIIRKESKTEDFFLTSSTFSWSTGSPGCLLVRDLNQKALDAAQDSFKLRKNDVNDFLGIYHGIGGLYLTLSHLNVEFKDFNFNSLIESQIKKHKNLLSYFPNNSDLVDLSFMRGEAGIGYAMLFYAYKTNRTESVLYPKVTFSKNYKKSAISSNNFNEIVLNKWMPNKGIANTSDRALSFYSEISNFFSLSHNLTLDSAINKASFELNQKNINPHYEYLRSKILKRDIKKLDLRSLRLRKSIRLLIFNNSPFILKKTKSEIQLIKLNRFGGAIMGNFKSVDSISINKVTSKILEVTEVSTEKEKQQVESKVKKMIFKFILDGVIDVN